MPKQKLYDSDQSIEVQWAKTGELVCVLVSEQIEVQTIDEHRETTAVEQRTVDSMWQATSPQQVDELISSLKRARRSAWPQS